MFGSTKEALKFINSRSYDERKGSSNYFNMLIEYTLKSIPIVEDFSCPTAQIEFINKRGFIIRYNPSCHLFVDDDANACVKKVAWALAHESLHLLLKHFDYEYDVKKDDHALMNIAQDSQVNSYLYKLGYCDVYKRDPEWKHMNISQVIEEYVRFSKEKAKENPVDQNTNSLVPDGFNFKSDTDNNCSCPMKLEGIVMGFERDDDVPDWEIMYKYLMKYCPKDSIELGEGNLGDGVGNFHSEWDTESQDMYIDRIFKGFAQSVDRSVDELTEELKKELNMKNLSFVMKKLKVEKLKGDWVRTLSKYLNGVNAVAGNIPTWARFSRRLGEGYIGKKVDRYQEVSVLVDVSGSMTEDIPRAIKQICQIATFIGRIKYFLTWDTAMCGEWRNINSKKLASLEIGSRGGTQLGEGFKQLAKKGGTKLLIVISDMETDESDYKVLNELSLTHNVILGLVQKDIHLAYNFFNNKVKVIPIGGSSNES